MKTSFLLFMLFLTACSQQEHKQHITSSHGRMWQDYVDQKLKQCDNESVLLALRMYEADSVSKEPRLKTKEDIEKLERMLKDGCVKYYKITI